MKEWILRRGCEKHPMNIPVKWWMYILLFPVIDIFLYEYKHFVDLVNEKGEIRRIYIKN